MSARSSTFTLGAKKPFHIFYRCVIYVIESIFWYILNFRCAQINVWIQHFIPISNFPVVTFNYLETLSSIQEDKYTLNSIPQNGDCENCGLL